MRTLSLVCLATFLCGMLSCSKVADGESDANRVSIAGKLGAGLAKRLSAAAPNQVIAIAVFDGSPPAIADGIVRLQVKAPVAADGTFDIAVPKEISEKWLLLLVDTSAADIRERVVGIASMGFTSSNLAALPVDLAASADIDLGTIEPDSADSNEMVSQTSPEANAERFSLSLSDLELLSNSDDMVRSIKNSYLASLDGKYRCVYPIFFWHLRNKDLTQHIDPMVSVTEVPPVYTVHIDVPANEITADAINANTAGLAIEPPSPITLFSFNVLENLPVGPVSSIPGDLLGGDSGPVEAGYTVVNTPYCSGAIVSGWWKLTRSGADYLYFDIGSGLQTDSEGKPKILVPSCRLIPKSNGDLSSVELQWHQYIGGDYVQITDYANLAAIAGNTLHIRIESDGTQSTNLYPSIDSPSVTDTTKTWKVTGGTDAQKVNGISLSYAVGGVYYVFYWRAD